jgi:hypothetical protein
MLACHMRYRGMDAILQGMDFGLPHELLRMVRTSQPLLELMASVGRNYTSDYNDGDDEPAYSTSTINRAEGKANLGDCGSSSLVSDDLLNGFENAFDKRAPSHKTRKSGDGSSIPTTSLNGYGIEIVTMLRVRVYNTDLKIYPGAFFGLLPEERLARAMGPSRKYASVTECFTSAVGGKAYVRLRIYKKQKQLPNEHGGVQRLVKELGLPFLTPTDTYTFRSAAELKYPLHVLHACGEDSCTNRFAFCNQSTAGGHDVITHPVYVLNTYHVGTANF